MTVMRRRTWPALFALAGVGCQFMTDPALPPSATRLVPPPVFTRWWAMTEACSGLSRDMSAVTWYVATGSPSISAGGQSDLAGYYSGASNRIVLADTAGLDGSVIRHEMLHALLGPSVSGHPRDEFLGHCAGTVECVDACISSAGPPPPPDPAAVTVTPQVLRVAGVLDPAAPTRGVDDGWFTFTILVTNPRSTPVSVTLAPASDVGPPVSFSWDATCLRTIQSCGNLGEMSIDERADDAASATRFAAGETKRFVVDFQIGRTGDVSWAIPAGAFAFRGFYNGQFSGPKSAPDTVILGP
jgi:hypothetical protein